MAATASGVKAGAAFVEIYATDSRLQRGLKAAEMRVKAFGAGVTAAGQRLAGLGAAVLGPIALSVRAFSGYEDAMAGLRAAANPTAESLQAIDAAVMDVSKATGRGPAEVAMAFGELLKAGVSLETILGGAGKAAIQFARVGELEVAEAAVVMNDAMNLFGASATEVVDTLSAAADASSVSIQDVVMSLSQAGLSARATGLSLEEAATALALMGQNGIKSSDAGTSLKTMLDRLRSGAGSAGSTIKKLGLNFRDSNGAMLPMRDLIGELQARLGRLDNVARDEALYDLFGSDAQRAGLVFLKAGVAGWDEFSAKMGEGLSVAEKADILMNTLSGSIAKAWAAIQRLGIAVGEALGADLQNGIDSVVGLIDAMADWARANAGTIKLIALIGAGLVAAGAAFIALGAVISGVATTFGALAAAIGFVTSPMGAAIATVAAFSAALRYGGPLIDLIADKSATLGATLLEMGRSAATTLAELGKSAFSGLVGALAALPGLASSAFGAIRDGVGRAASAVGAFLGGEAGFLAEQFPAVAFIARNAFRAISGYVYVMRSLVSRAFKDIPVVAGLAFKAIRAAAGVAFAPIAFAADKAFDVITAGFYVVRSIAGRAFKDLPTVVGFAFRALVSQADAIFPEVVAVARRSASAAASAFGAIGNFIAAIPGRAMAAFSAIGPFVGQAFGAVTSTIGDALGSIGGYLASIPGAVSSVFGEIATAGQAAWMGLKADALAAFQGIGDALKAGDIGLAAEILWLTIRVQFQQGVNALKSIWADWGTAFRTVMSNISFFFADAIFALPQLLNTVIARLLDLMGPFTDLLKDTFGVDLPARVAKSGEDFAAMRQALAEDKAVADEARFAAARASVAEGEAELARLRGELQAALDEAKSKVAAGAAPAAEKAAEGAVEAALTPEGIGQSIGRAASKVETAGGFSAAAFRGLGIGSSVEADQLTEQKEQTKLLRRIDDRARQGKLVFTA